jgi:hypothetical protein
VIKPSVINAVRPAGGDAEVRGWRVRGRRVENIAFKYEIEHVKYYRVQIVMLLYKQQMAAEVHTL